MVKTNVYKNDNIKIFTYEYGKFTSNIDTFLIRNDSLFKNKVVAKYISKKRFHQNGKDIEVKKYFWSSGNPHSLMNYYMNEEKGLIIIETGESTICEFSYKSNRKLLNDIIRDKSFFNFELGK